MNPTVNPRPARGFPKKQSRRAGEFAAPHFLLCSGTLKKILRNHSALDAKKIKETHCGDLRVSMLVTIFRKFDFTLRTRLHIREKNPQIPFLRTPLLLQ